MCFHTGVSAVNFEHVQLTNQYIVLVQLVIILNMHLPACVLIAIISRCTLKFGNSDIAIRDHSFVTFAKFPERAITVPPLPPLPSPYTHTYVYVSGSNKCLFFGKFCKRNKGFIFTYSNQLIFQYNYIIFTCSCRKVFCL